MFTWQSLRVLAAVQSCGLHSWGVMSLVISYRTSDHDHHCYSAPKSIMFWPPSTQCEMKPSATDVCIVKRGKTSVRLQTFRSLYSAKHLVAPVHQTKPRVATHTNQNKSAWLSLNRCCPRLPVLARFRDKTSRWMYTTDRFINRLHSHTVLWSQRLQCMMGKIHEGY